MQKLLDRLFPKKAIVNCDRNVYLHRWFVVRTKFLGVFIHKFELSDEDRALHDHPWNFLVVPLFRGYNEFNAKGVHRVWPIIGTRFRRGTYRHRVELIDGKPSWSLFFRFRRFRIWGFWPKTGFMAWNVWWTAHCED
jgi:hypothetical protein